MGNAFDLVLAIFGLFAVLALGGGAVYAALRWYRNLQKPVNDVNTLLAQFRELHDRGEISDTEYQTIKTQLSYQIRDELREAKRRR